MNMKIPRTWLFSSNVIEKDTWPLRSAKNVEILRPDFFQRVNCYQMKLLTPSIIKKSN